MRRDERGFTLIETLCAVAVTSLTILTAAGLWQASQAQERRAEMQFAISRHAVSEMERMRAKASLTEGSVTTRMMQNGVTVSLQKVIERDAGLYRITLTYSWQEGGRIDEQIWATLHR
jgi:prepilin-type N-terminal cleavage/methylation domain-containing protein